MATNTWIAASNGNWSADANWSLGHKPISTEDVVFNITSVKNCTVDESPTVASLTITSAYTGVWNSSGQTITCSGNFDDNGATNTHTYGDFIFSGASATVNFRPGVAAVCAGGSITMNGTTAMGLTMGANASTTATSMFKSLTLGASAKVTSSGGVTQNFKGACPLLTLGASASLTLNSSMTLNPTGAGNLFLLGAGYTITGVSTFTGNIFTNSITVNIPALTTVSTLNVAFNYQTGVTNSTWMVTGNMSVYALVTWGCGAGCVFDFNGFNLTVGAGGAILIGGTNELTVHLRTGTISIPTSVLRTNAATNSVINFNSANITCQALQLFYNYGNGIHNLGTSTISCTALTVGAVPCTINFQDSIITANSSVSVSSQNTINAGNAMIIMSGTAAADITSSGKTLPIIKLITTNGRTVRLIDNLICTNFILMSGGVNLNSKTLTTVVKNPSMSANVPLSPLTVSTCINMQPAPLISIR